MFTRFVSTNSLFEQKTDSPSENNLTTKMIEFTQAAIKKLHQKLHTGFTPMNDDLVICRATEQQKSFSVKNDDESGLASFGHPVGIVLNRRGSDVFYRLPHTERIYGSFSK